jgi:hypothetical protein
MILERQQGAGERRVIAAKIEQARTQCRVWCGDARGAMHRRATQERLQKGFHVH